MEPEPRSSSSSSRLIPVDALRGLIMIFMALDHASYFLAKAHAAEYWGLPLPQYQSPMAFLLATLGINLLLLALFSRMEETLKRWGKPLLVFGRTALFFYIVHLYVYGLSGLAFPKGVPFSWMYLFWLGGLVLLYFLCSRYSRFKAQKAPDSVWRMF